MKFQTTLAHALLSSSFFKSSNVEMGGFKSAHFKVQLSRRSALRVVLIGVLTNAPHRVEALDRLDRQHQHEPVFLLGHEHLVVPHRFEDPSDHVAAVAVEELVGHIDTDEVVVFIIGDHHVADLERIRAAIVAVTHDLEPHFTAAGPEDLSGDGRVVRVVVDAPPHIEPLTRFEEHAARSGRNVAIESRRILDHGSETLEDDLLRFLHADGDAATVDQQIHAADPGFLDLHVGGGQKGQTLDLRHGSISLLNGQASLLAITV